MIGFEGRTVLVTGAATGLGRAVARLAATSGARVAVLDIQDEEGRAAAIETGGRYWRLDVASSRDWPAVVDEVERAFGPIHYAHLNAGVMSRPPAEGLAGAGVAEVSLERYRKVMGVNVDGVFFGFQALLPRMNAGEGEAVTVTSSAAGLIPIPFDPVYAMSKHAVIGLTRSLALGHADGRTRINALCPGGFSSALLPAAFHTAATMTPEHLAVEVLDLLARGPNGETRLKLGSETPAQSIAPPLSSLG